MSENNKETMSLAEALPREIGRVARLLGQLNAAPPEKVRPGVALATFLFGAEAALEAAYKAIGSGDCVDELRAYHALKEI